MGFSSSLLFLFSPSYHGWASPLSLFGLPLDWKIHTHSYLHTVDYVRMVGSPPWKLGSGLGLGQYWLGDDDGLAWLGSTLACLCQCNRQGSVVFVLPRGF